MILNKLSSDQIVTYWEYIKFAAVSANGMEESNQLEEFCRNLLCNLLSFKYQCWMGVSNNKQQIKGVAITKINKDVGNISHLLIDTLYVYETTEIKSRLHFIETLKKFGTDLKCNDIIFYTNNLNLIRVAEKIGFNESHKVYNMNLGGI